MAASSAVTSSSNTSPFAGHGSRVLLLLGQSPFDPTSGAAQSTRLIAETLARSGFEVRALATTACEGDLADGHDAVLTELDPHLRQQRSEGLLRFAHARVSYALLPVEPRWKHTWEFQGGVAYEAEFKRILEAWHPDIVLTYGGDSTDVSRRRRARHAGATVVFALHNLAYRKRQPEEVDAFLVPTKFMADAYAHRLGAPIEILPAPLDPERVLAHDPEAGAVCFINPEPAKGVLLVAELARRLGEQRPDIPLLVVGGRAPADSLAVAGRDLGFDLTVFPNLVQIPPVGRVSEIWKAARVVLMPSVVKEAAGRCALEAMLNGVVPLVSDQGGLAEIVGEAGIRLPPPPELAGRAQAVPSAIVDAWWQQLTGAFDHPIDYQRRSSSCRALASRHTIDHLAPRYSDWFSAQISSKISRAP